MKKPHILAAEDDPVSRQFLKRILGHLNFQIDVARDGREAVDMWEGGGYDAIVMDVQMPKLDGLAATRMIREKERSRGGHIPIVAMTGHASAEDADRCIRAGMDGCITKPVDIVKAAAVLHRLLDEKGEK